MLDSRPEAVGTEGPSRRGSASWRSDEQDCGPAGSSLDSKNLSEPREDFPRLTWAKGLGPGPHDSWKEPKKKLLSLLFDSATKPLLH